MYDLIVIGGGPGGYEAAAHAGRMGKKVALIEKDRLGGACLNVGCIPAKTFLRSSRLFRECGEAARYGVRVGSVEFDLPAVVDRKNRIVATLGKGVQSMLKRAGVEIIAGHARLVSRKVVQSGAQLYETANVLIATGSRPAVHAEGVLDSDTVFSLDRVPESIAIVGGGYIGLEFACFFQEVGARVAVFEMLPRIVPSSDGEISSRLLQILTRKGIEFHLSSKDGAAASAGYHAILNAAGRAPVVEGLGLEDVGVDFGSAGIRASDRGKTNVPGVWACGDVTGRRMLAHAATREGIAAVNNMFGIKDRIRYNAIPAVIYTHPEVASVGRTEEELQAEGIEYKKSVAPMGVAGRFLIESEGGTGMVKVLAGARYGDILGVHAIGDGSSEFIVAAAAMMETEMSVSDAGGIVFPHPTVSEALREAIRGVH
jgi:dihydrolipoamide dehydrogenase